MGTAMGDEIHEELLAKPPFLQLFSHVHPRYDGWLLRYIADDAADVVNANDDDGYENHDAKHDMHPGDDGPDDDYGQHDGHDGFVDDYEGYDFADDALHDGNMHDGLIVPCFYHYMNMLLPTSHSKMGMLVEKVDVDMQTAEKREFTAQGMSMLKSMRLGRRSPSNNMISSPMGETGINKADMANMTKSEMVVMAMRKAEMENMNKGDGTPMTRAEKRASWANQMIMSTGGVATMRKCAKECEGKTDRQLSRLWIDAGGGRPTGEGFGTANGVGLGFNGRM